MCNGLERGVTERDGVGRSININTCVPMHNVADWDGT